MPRDVISIEMNAGLTWIVQAINQQGKTLGSQANQINYRLTGTVPWIYFGARIQNRSICRTIVVVVNAKFFDLEKRINVLSVVVLTAKTSFRT